MPVLTAGRTAELCGGRVIGDADAAATSVVADSRSVSRGVAFAAVRGGHDFVADAISAGAAYVVVERSDVAERLGSTVKATIVVVADTVRALGALATEFRSALDVRVVAITGSTGKTLTKDFVGAVARAGFRVHAAPSSFNAEIGVPLVVLSCPDDAQVMVCELAARHAGEIAELAAITKPDIGVITGIGVAHLSEFGSRTTIANTKTELLDALGADGLAVVPSDDDFVALFSERTRARLTTVGPGGHTRYLAESIDTDGRTHGRVWIGREPVSVALPVPGRALMRNAALAIRVGVELGIEPSRAVGAIAGAELTSWRMELVKMGGWLVVNDAWNANPTSVASALRTVRELRPEAPAWAVLGPMAELGAASAAAHTYVGRLAVSLGFIGVITVGPSAGGIADGAGGIAHRAGCQEEAADLLLRSAADGAIVLVKGSRVAGLEAFPALLGARRDVTRQEA